MELPDNIKALLCSNVDEDGKDRKSVTVGLKVDIC